MKPRFLHAVWVAAIAALLGLHFVHLRADFPNFSPWMDYAKYTDEGWYGNAAIHHALGGAWYHPGDFNPAAALPVWPLLETALFAVFGVSLVAARSLALVLFAANLVLSYALLRRFVTRPVAMLGVTFLAASAFLWAFSRLAILEPLLILLTLSAWLIALRLPRTGAAKVASLGAIGLLLCLAVLTKTTAVFLVPAALLLVWHAERYRLRAGLASALIVATGGLVPWLLYYALLAREHFLGDYHYLFAANQWVQPTTLSGRLWAWWFALHGTLWVDPTLCGLALAVLAFSLLLARRVWINPLVLASFAASFGYIFFIGWHNSPQPRYYQVVAYPLVFITCIGIAAVDRRSRLLGGAAYAVFAVTVALNVRGEVHFARHPEYTFVDAAQGLTHYIDQHPNGNRLLLSISGDDITLITHLPAICDDFGTYDLPRRIHVYQPGWYAAWNELDPGTLEDLHTQYSLEQVATFHAFDDEDRDELILYKLHPLPAARQTYDPAEESGAGN
jgi:4-amino-4-deoxy-L-arabinose transferase-like glycosyltransferase